jgi:eukaryotic-like serine/threonine-protein kinase
MQADSAGIVRFGVFEVDLRSGELRKRGIKVPLQQQPFRILVRLLERPGELVPRDVLRQELWPEDTFVDFEHGLNAAIKRLREALGDSADTPRFVETLPRRGYRFIAPLTAADVHTAPSAAQVSAVATPFPRRWVLSAAALTILALVGVATLHTRRAVALTDRDTLLVADFVNRTGDPVFDGTLREALTIALEQSPFLSVVSREHVRRILTEMQRPADAALVDATAREACQRLGARMSINGSIAALGRQHVVTLEAVDCQSGDTVATVRGDAADREHVLTALDGAASALRQRLGESRAALERFNMPLREATTASLEALRAFSAAEQVRELKGEGPAEPLYRRALELDPEFAMAYARLSAVLVNTGAPADQFLDVTKEAVRRRNRVTERERLYIDYRGCALSGDPDCSIHVAEAWRRTYSKDWEPYSQLCYAYTSSRAEFEKALPDCVEAVRLNPTHSVTMINLVAAYRALNQFDQARRVTEEALARHVDTEHIREARYSLAFIAGDAAAMAAEARAVSSEPLLPDFVLLEAKAAAFLGHFKEARDQRARAEALSAGRIPLFEASSQWQGAAFEAAAGFAVGIPSVPPDRAVAHALVLFLLRGDWPRVEGILATPFGKGGVPPRAAIPARALMAVERGDRTAIQRLPGPQSMDLALTAEYRPVFLRGLAYLRAGDAVKAAAEFQRIIDHRGIDPTSPYYPIAYVHQARAYVASGDLTRARRSYEQFLTLWQTADPDVPLLNDVKAEYNRLPAR